MTPEKRQEWYDRGYKDGYEENAKVLPRNLDLEAKSAYYNGYDDGWYTLQEDLETNWGMGEDW